MMSVPSLSGHAVAYRWRSLHYRESVGTGPVNLKVVEFQTGAVLPWQVTMDQFIHMRLSFSRPLLLKSKGIGMSAISEMKEKQKNLVHVLA